MKTHQNYQKPYLVSTSGCSAPPAFKFRFSSFDGGVVLQETDPNETYLLTHGPYLDVQEAFCAMQCILETGQPPVPTKAA